MTDFYMMATLAFNEFSELKQINQLPCLLKLSDNFENISYMGSVQQKFFANVFIFIIFFL